MDASGSSFKLLEYLHSITTLGLSSLCVPDGCMWLGICPARLGRLEPGCVGHLVRHVMLQTSNLALASKVGCMNGCLGASKALY